MSTAFRLEFNPSPIPNKITIEQRILLLGSCFTNHIFDRLHLHKFHVVQNPNGILFNPLSIFHSLRQYLGADVIREEELFLHQGIWNHWSFHSSYSDADRSIALDKMNRSIRSANKFLQKTDWLFITLGSAFVYEHSTAGVVANCHKYPSDQFKKYLLDPSQIVNEFTRLMEEVQKVNRNIRVVLTVSPVRHLRDGFVENNRSKAVLFHAIDKITSQHAAVDYFPAYELIVDDLRDYRFYAEDMVHPNYLATQYVWEKFVETCIDGKTQQVMKDIQQLQQAFKHRPMHPNSTEHEKFRQKFKEMATQLSNRFPSLNFSDELNYFS
jgi:GSCFA family